MSAIRRGAWAAVLMLLVAGGCASSPQSEAGQTPDEAIASTVTQFIGGMAASNGDQIASTLAASFHDDEYGGRDAFAETMRQFTNIRYFDGLSADTSGMTITLTGDSATAAPAALSGPFGALVASFSLAREEQAWRIAGVTFTDL
ncbi:MAG: hypothetical protein GC168_11785 [Candidatus Hydrogenedens sp.]|nr:hypothetical protein [Candidatus Hydrogenedens sp.]